MDLAVVPLDMYVVRKWALAVQKTANVGDLPHTAGMAGELLLTSLYFSHSNFLSIFLLVVT